MIDSVLEINIACENVNPFGFPYGVRVIQCPRIRIWVHRWSGWILIWVLDAHPFWVSTNLRLAWIYWFGGYCPRYPRTLTWSIILRSGRTSPPLLWKWELNGFYWYLHSFGRIGSRIRGFSDTLIISKCFWQVIYKTLQVYDFMNFLFSLLSTWIQGGNALGIPVDFLAFTLVLEISP